MQLEQQARERQKNEPQDRYTGRKLPPRGYHRGRQTMAIHTDGEEKLTSGTVSEKRAASIMSTRESPLGGNLRHGTNDEALLLSAEVNDDGQHLSPQSRRTTIHDTLVTLNTTNNKHISI